MDKSTPLQEVAHLLDPALDSKIQELHLYGYDSVNAESIWNYLVNKKWKEIEGDLPLYLVVNDILTLKSGDFMNFTTRMEYKSAASSRKFNEDELQSLLHGQEGEKKDKSE
ncbi:post-transcriptional regulator [Jeotgalibacillus proteolyticus]|nr:post-transcriptional regulator [Jeotgalibacillus proteolyticus]